MLSASPLASFFGCGGASVTMVIDFSALRRAYLSDRVGSEVSVEGIDGAAAREAGRPALLPAKLASNFARSTARLDGMPQQLATIFFSRNSGAAHKRRAARPGHGPCHILVLKLDPEPPPHKKRQEI